MILKIKKMNDKAIIPFNATNGSAGYDLFADIDEDIVIEPMKRAFIPTGLIMEIPKGYGGFIYARSGTACKFGVTLPNCVGVIDSDYRGEIKVALINLSDEPYTVRYKDRIAQIVISPVCNVEFSEAENLSDTDRNSGGFGSTGK